jgi:hypothetical protein
MKFVKLPDREEITLREAVTAFVFGEARDASSGRFYPSLATDALLRELYNAAQTGRIRFRAIKIGDSKYQEIDCSYFGTRFEFDWNKNEIQSWGLADEQMGLEGEVLGVDWHDVYLDRQQFSLLLSDLGVSVDETRNPQTLGVDAPKDGRTYKTGAAGRPTSMHFALRIAQQLLDAEDCPNTKTAFSEQVAAKLKDTYPEAAQVKPKTIRNNPDFNELWRHKTPKKNEPI